ncbi:Nuclear transcription factor Y subunit B-3 [Platanthera guangdongensis]|uniref:Nuclear transcription factor Y subunit B-3 n=1 Tax=Platanthera guangdongensis TaxID=2320717 RepID=A0ABR2LHG3_9ASPA
MGGENRRRRRPGLQSPSLQSQAVARPPAARPLAGLAASERKSLRKALPANAKISKDTKETVQDCVFELISFSTGEASDKCRREKRKTINGNDLLWG